MFLAPDGLAYPKATPAEVTAAMGPAAATALSWIPAVILTQAGGGVRATSACRTDARESATLEGPAGVAGGDTSQGTSGLASTVKSGSVLAAGNELKNSFHTLTREFHVKLGTSTCKGGMPVASSGMQVPSHERPGGVLCSHR